MDTTARFDTEEARDAGPFRVLRGGYWLNYRGRLLDVTGSESW